MKKCTKCGKKHEGNDQDEVCLDCGNKLERVLESVFKEESINKIKKYSFVYLSLSLLIVATLSVLTIKLVEANRSIAKEKNQASYLALSLQKSDNELKALQDNLSKTEEGRKQLEAAKEAVETENQQLDTRATNAEQTASKATADLTKTRSELSAKQIELSKISNDLTAKQNELSKAQRGIALFDKTESLFKSFDQSSANFTAYVGQAYESVLANDSASTQKYVDLMSSEFSKLGSLYKQIDGIFTQIKTGNY